MLFKGYDTPMVAEAAKMASRFFPDFDIPARDRFGLLLDKNISINDRYRVGTGAGKYPFGKILSWNEKPKLPYWYSESCNQINGTDGAQFAPFLTKSEKLYVFSSYLCRSIHLTYEKTTQVNGVKTQR